MSFQPNQRNPVDPISKTNLSMIHPNLKYRPDIDGLRAIAVLGVLIFHLNESFLSGGYVGVDVFFVISGFLITSIILRDLDQGAFSILKFYERRIRRIAPALFVMFVVVCAFAMRFLLPTDLLEFAKSLRYSLLSISNFHFLNASEDYFHQGVAEMPLLHTWSLSVEEQFYILFPILIMLAHRFLKSRSRLAVFFGALSLLSLLLSQWVVSQTPDKAFYLLPWRAWELMLGSLLAILSLPIHRSWWVQFLGVLGLGLIIYSMVSFDKTTVFPGFSALLPCVGTTLVIYAGRAGTGLSTRILSFKPIVFIGLISYSVYLWHWPLITFAKYTFHYSHPMMVAVMAGSVAVGFLSWYFVERPFRNPALLSRRKIFSSWAVASLILLVAAISTKNADGFPRRFSDQVNHYLNITTISERPKPMVGVIDRYDPNQAPIFGDDSAPPSIALWGDSHAGALLPMLHRIGQESGKSFISYDMPGQPPMTEVTQLEKSDRVNRSAYSREVLDSLKKNTSIRKVILHARWTSYTKGDVLLGNSKPQPIYGHPFETWEKQQAYIASRFDMVIRELLEAKKTVVIVYPIPETGVNIPLFLAKLAAAGETAPDHLPSLNFVVNHRDTLQMLDFWKDHPGVITIRPDRTLLDADQVRVQIEGQPLFRDDDHLSMAGSLLLRDLFEPIFREP